ncbi:MAG TPA: glycosyltransferase [Acidobacteriaceae bacterium]|jgi:ceramide glucosyltransferase|nr:glycosyltransferase [Acidobacteriaceae bacterium]
MTVGHILGIALSAFAVFGVVTSTVFSFLVVAGVQRFRRIPASLPNPPYLPPVSVLKPLHGDEPDLEANLTSFFEQEYPDYEILFCARHANDKGLEIARKVAARFPNVSSRILTCGEPPWPNARTFSLEIMRREARNQILVAGDSDVRVGRDYLASVVQPMRDPGVGMVTCVYRGVTRHGLWAQLEAIGMSVEMTSGVLTANLLEGMQFALGPSMVMRQSSVEKIGGFEKVAQYYADDFVLGNWIAQTGEKVILSPYIIEHHILNASLKSSLAHQQGWATSTRFSRPMGHLGEVLTYAIPFGMLGMLSLISLGHPWLGLGVLGITVLDRLMLCVLVAGMVVHDRAALRRPWLYLLRDFMGFCFWVRSYAAGNRVGYRGELYELLSEGRLRKLEPGA